MKLENKVAIVTGGASGIGEAIVLKFVREGAAVVVADLPDMAVQDVVDAINLQGGRAAAYLGDLSEEDHAKACVQVAVDTFGQLDILASNAGVFPQLAPVVDFETTSFETLIKGNLRAAFFVTKYAIPELRKSRGAIVYTGSTAGVNGQAQVAAYSGTKGFTLSFMQGVAMEEAANGVRANAVAPGVISTAWNIPGHGGPLSKEFAEQSKDLMPLGRMGTPEEVANVVTFLASSEASYVTGAVFIADGGLTVANGAPGQQVPDDLRKEPEITLPLRHRTDGFIGKQVVDPVGEPA